MAENRGFDILDYFVLLVKWRKFLLITLISVFVLSYLTIYFFVPEEFESQTLIIPTGSETSMSGIAGVMKNLKDLPFGLGGTSKTAETDLYITILNSRTTLEKMVKKFNLMQDYDLKSMEKTIKKLAKNIDAGLTKENAFRISVRANSPQKAADMANYLLSLLNETVIKMNVSKSRDNREFLETRYNEIKTRLRNAEDSLQLFQQSSGMLEAKEQPKLILNAYSKLQGEVMSKQLELAITEKIVSKDSPQLNLLKTQLNEYEAELAKMKSRGEDKDLLLSLNSLPEKTKDYIRHYRNVEIFNSILEFIVPMYEQAKFEEQKNIPVMQIVDYPSIPEKRVYPLRTLISAIVTFVVFFIVVLFIIVRDLFSRTRNTKIIMIKNELSLTRKSEG